MPAGLMASAAPTRIPERPDFARMQRARMDRIRGIMRQQGLDALVLLGNTNVAYATGAIWPLADSGRANFEQPVAVVLVGDDWPHLFTPVREDDRLRTAMPADHIHGPVYLDFDEGVQLFAAQLTELVSDHAVIAMDEWTNALRRERSVLFAAGAPSDGGRVISAAKVTKTPDELSCMREGLRITECAIADVQARIAPGVRQTELTATFLRSTFEAGADANILDPIWQVMPDRIEDGPWTTTGGIACPLLSTERELVKGDVLWVDTGISYGGFHSDFGRTWVVGQEPSARQRDQFEQWRSIMGAVLEVTKAGATAADLTAAAIAAAGGEKPWMPHFYLGHGLGIDSAEMPYVGSDIGEAFDATLVLEEGMVLVLEPLVWDDGAAGYRSEEVLLITEGGWEPMTDYPYDPFSEPMTVVEVLPDEAALRQARRARVLAEMEAADIDVLIVGREGNARYVSGAPRLWTAGSRAFGPGCVLVRESGAVHLLSTWDEGIPDDIPHENLYGISFNAMSFVKVLQGIQGAAKARTVATDSMTGSSANLLPKAFPSAELIDGEPLLRRVRQVKAPEEIAAIRASVRHRGGRAGRGHQGARARRDRAGAHRRVHGGHGVGRRDDPGRAGCGLAHLARASVASFEPGRRSPGRRSGGLRGRRDLRRIRGRSGPDVFGGGGGVVDRGAGPAVRRVVGSAHRCLPGRGAVARAS